MREAFLYPGQGAQQVGMGQDLFAQFPEHVAIANDLLGYDLVELCLEDRQGLLGETQYTQPALYVVSVLHRLAKEAAGDAPAACHAGHSLGEYVALEAAGVFDFAEGLRLIKGRAACMSRVEGGGMTAVIGLDQAALAARIEASGYDRVYLANQNTQTQLVLSGDRQQLAALGEALKAEKLKVVHLDVSGAFHSPYMAAAAADFADLLAEARLQAPQVPVYANVTAAPYPDEPAEIRRLLVEQLTAPVRWVDTILAMQRDGVREFTPVGPGRVIGGLVRTIRKIANF